MDRLVLWKSDARFLLAGVARRLLGRGAGRPRMRSRVPVRTIKKLIRQKGFAVTNGQPSWFYTAYQRGDADPLTNHALEFIRSNVPPGGRILMTGCGTGIMLFHLADQGFTNLEGFDFLPECVAVATAVAELGDYRVKIWQMDGFDPRLDGNYDVITALHWVFSAWMGNYGNDAIGIAEAKRPETRERLLSEFLSRYAPHLNAGGFLIIELTDAVTDYRLPADHALGEASASIYPVRHSPEQVARCAASQGLEVYSKSLCVSFGHHPRTSYILRKT